MKLPVKRRSIVQFEQWLDTQIVEAQMELARADAVAEQVARQRAAQEVRLETLRMVKAKLKPLTPVGDFDTLPIAESMDEDDHRVPEHA